MKMVAKIFNILFFVVLCESKKSLVPQAILQLVRNYYGERPVVIEVFYNSREVEILDETLKLLSSEKQLKVTPINKNVAILNERYGIICTSDCDGDCLDVFLKDAIFLFDTIANYHKFIWNLHMGFIFDYEIKHLVYCEDASEINIQEIITRGAEKIGMRVPLITYESFMLEQDGRITIQAMMLYTEKKCSAEQLVEMNQFSSLEKKWKTEKFFPPRIENFHGCELKIGVDPSLEIGLPFIRVLEKEDGTETAEGSIVDMFGALSNHLNFTYVFIDASYRGNISGSIYSAHDFDIIIGANGQQEPTGITLTKRSPTSDPIYTTSDVFVVPPGEFFTSWEKLFLPFDWQTWMWLGITFAAAFLVILLIKVSKSTSIYDLVIGSNVTTPSLNVVAIFMGMSQVLRPRRIVTRFLFMNFILFSLIMRTAYQGKYFEFLTSDMRRKPIQTIEGLKDKDFKGIVGHPMCFENCRHELKEQE